MFNEYLKHKICEQTKIFIINVEYQQNRILTGTSMKKNLKFTYQEIWLVEKKLQMQQDLCLSH